MPSRSPATEIKDSRSRTSGRSKKSPKYSAGTPARSKCAARVLSTPCVRAKTACWLYPPG